LNVKNLATGYASNNVRPISSLDDGRTRILQDLFCPNGNLIQNHILFKDTLAFN